ncbi:MAG: phage holin [Clostridia bacterium]|nr:phage holin [Clostridia bacterium]
MKIEKGTIIRTVLLVISFINMGLEMAGKGVLPFSNEEVSAFVSYIWAAVSAIVAWWKNNSFTKQAIEADKVLNKLKKAGK